MNRKHFTAPVYLLVPLIIMQAFALYFFVSMSVHSLSSEREFIRKYGVDNGNAPRTSEKFIRESMRAGTTILVLIGESIIFWRIRKKRYNRWLTIGYILPLIFILVVLPIMALRMGIPFDWLVPNDMLYWTGIGIAHVFLAIMVWQSRKKKAFIPTNPANILDDYAENN